MDNKLKIVFMGTPEFALPALKVLTKQESVVAVYTQPDRPSGRGQKLTPPPVKVYAQKQGLLCHQPKTLKSIDEIQKLNALHPDLIVVVAYGLFLPKKFLKIPKYRCINIHPSLLPRYRGAAPMQWALINGDAVTGVSIAEVTPKMDAGNILKQKAVEIKEEDTLETLHDKLSELGAKLLMETLQDLKQKTLRIKKQDEKSVTLAPKLSKEISLIDWHQSARQIFNLIRGANPWPGTHTYLEQMPLKIYKAKITHESFKGTAGKISKIDPEGIEVETPKGRLLLTVVQKPNKKKMSAWEFKKGTPLKVGQILGKTP